MANILVTRFSALGDVAMTVCVLKAFADTYPGHHITLLSRPFVAPLLEGLPENVHFRPVNLNDYKGLRGLSRLSRELRQEGFDMIADFHDVLRTKILCICFKLASLPVAVIDKGRRERKLLTRAKDKQLHQLKTSQQRYADVLAKLGFPVELRPYHIYSPAPADISDLIGITGKPEGDRWVGIAPFAAHEGKIYPLLLMKQVVEKFAALPRVKVFLFGNGDKERAWCEQFHLPNVISMVGKTNLQKELRLMSNLRVMLTMDSANMHLAALAGVPTLSIWGATHPFAGFTGLQAEGSRQLQLDLDCRPCSIFGNKACARGNCPCLTGITPDQVVNTLKQYLCP